MNFEALQRRVARREALAEQRAVRARSAYAALQARWRESWTPTRILVAGLAAGFVLGRARPARAMGHLGKLGGSRWLQAFNVVAGLLAPLQAALAATSAQQAAAASEACADAGQAAADARADAGPVAAANPLAEAVPARPHPDRRRPDPVFAAQPQAAEAATDVSER